MNVWRFGYPGYPRAALLAWLAVLTLVIAPTVSRALTPLDPAHYRTDLCRSGDDAVAHDALSACGLCAVAAAPLLPAAALAECAPPAGAAPPWPAPGPAAVPARHRPAQARGPPGLG